MLTRIRFVFVRLKYALALEKFVMSVSHSQSVVLAAVKSYREQSWQWEPQDTDYSDAELALAYWDFKEFVTLGSTLFERITDFDEDYRRFVLQGKLKWSEEIQAATMLMYCEWYGAVKLVIDLIPFFERQFGRVENAKRIKKYYRQAEGILTPDEEFFADEKLITLRDEAIEQFREGLTIECGKG